jgi:hypothetical protein
MSLVDCWVGEVVGAAEATTRYMSGATSGGVGRWQTRTKRMQYVVVECDENYVISEYFVVVHERIIFLRLVSYETELSNRRRSIIKRVKFTRIIESTLSCE